MQTASCSTNNRPTFDTRPPIYGRNITSVFPKTLSIKHQGTGPIKAALILPMIAAEILFDLPGLLLFRFRRKSHGKKKDIGDLRVAYVADTLDEVNGIANNLREVTSYMQSHGMNAILVGCADHTRSRGVIENGYTFLLPRFFSMEAIGYANTELALPHFASLAKLLIRYPVDLIEVETPLSVGWAAVIAARIAGIRVISHFRTDALGYVRLLVKAKWIHTAALWLCRGLYFLARPVISPCETYKGVLYKEMLVPESQIKILPRGIALDSYSPEFRGKGIWEGIFHSQRRKTRFLFVGRISKEKDIPFLEDVWHDFHKTHPDAELAFAGDGWYLEILKKNFSPEEDVFFAGLRGGKELAGLYADADYFLFPSGTDTFGNVVVEALASGTPAIVSDRGGPQDIVRDKGCGIILPFRDKEKWFRALEDCTQKAGSVEYESMRKNAVKRSLDFSLERSANAQWEFFAEICGCLRDKKLDCPTHRKIHHDDRQSK